MPRVPIPLIGPSYANRSLPLSAQVSKGLIPEINPEARNIVSLHAFPGLKVFASLSGAGRGTHVMDGLLYAVYGDTLSSIDESGVVTSIGTIVGQTICGFANNGLQMIIATGITTYMYTAATEVLEVITDSSVEKSTTVGYINSHFILDNNQTDSKRGEFVATQITTDLTADEFVNILDKSSADGHPDSISKILIYNGMVLFFGTDGIDPWFNSGSGSPPFVPIQQGFRPYGVAGPDAIAKTDEFVYFLDDQRIPRRMFGLTVTNIGNPALAAEWAKYTRVDNAVAMAYIIDNNNYFQINFPTDNRTSLYHEQSNSWYQLSFGTDDQRHRGLTHQFVYGKNIIQDYANGQLYELDFETFTDNGEVIQRKRTTATIHGGLYGVPGQKLWFDKVQFVIQTGVGINTGQGSDPKLMVRYSDDGGRTYSAEQKADLGQGGEYMTKVELYQQGSSYERLYEISYTEPTPFALIDAQADITVGL